MNSFNIGTINNELSDAHLAQKVDTIEISAKGFESTIHQGMVVMHLYLMLLSPSAGKDHYRIQLDVNCSLVNGIVQPDVTMTGRDVIPTGSHIATVLSFAILEPHNIAVGDLLELLTSAGLDSTTVNVYNTACGRFCFQSLKVFAEKGLI
ncbi:hypothetical protein ARMGADRAFT_1084755 [Armillaria gallica]|uniref:Uncharacterized protein n=1 Tax=Armillaria gallica TaxID=47427 RepID=A0A2H3CZF6_ARMGA|nr:hypothetical protein ARMGADRAFT_1084755 [Armillaria gallica]